MKELLELQQRAKKILDDLRAERKAETPDAAKVRTLEDELQKSVRDIDIKKAELAADGVAQPEDRAAPAAKPKTESDKRREASDQYLRHGVVSPELRDMTEGTSTGGDTGGFLMWEEYENQIIEAMRNIRVMRRLADVQTSGLDRTIPVATDKTAAYWIGEGAAFTESDAAFGQIKLNAYKDGALCKISRELLEDNQYNLEQWIGTDMAEAIAELAETAYFQGTGTGQPKGFLLDAETVAAAGANIAYGDLLNLFGALKPSYFRNATWLMNSGTLVKLMQLADAAGQYLYSPFNAPQSNGPLGTILGRPVEISE
jgi:HK97 family phage major capsid protein